MKHSNALTFLVAFLALVALGFVLSLLKEVFFPLILALFISIMSYPVLDFFRQKKVPSGLRILLVLVVVAGVLGIAMLVLAIGVEGFVTGLPRYEEKTDRLVSQAVVWVQAFLVKLGQDPASLKVSHFVDLSAFAGLLASSAGTIVSMLGGLFMTLLFLVFLLADADGFGRKLSQAFTGAHRLEAVFKEISASVRRYMLTKTAISLLTSILVWIVLMLFGVDFALLFALLTFLLNFIPNFGSIIAAVLPTLLAFLQFESIGIALGVAASLVVVQNVIGNLLEPRVMGKGLNLSPVTILLSLILWGWLWGVWGMFIAVPVTASLRIVCDHVESLRPLGVLMGAENEWQSSIRTRP